LRRFFQEFPYHIFFFASFPVISLFAWNVSEVDSSVIWRPLIIANILVLFFFGLLLLITRNLQKSGMMASLLILLFFSFGHLFGWLRSISGIGELIGRFRYLVPLFILIIVLFVYLIFRKLKDTRQITSILNFVGIVLLALPLYRAISYTVKVSQKPASVDLPTQFHLQKVEGKPLPDIYFIVLDGYIRQDRLLKDYGYDNSEFIQKLRDLGFYVVDCSRSNYGYTNRSIPSTLNLDYVQTMEQNPVAPGMSTDEDLTYKLEHNQARMALKELGYQFVAFDSGARWSSFTTADIFYGIPLNLLDRNISEFEALLLKNSMAIMAVGGEPTKFNDLIQGKDSDEVNYWPGHIERIRNILKLLPGTANLSGPKFVFAHIVSPHTPYVFNPDGTLITDKRYFVNDGLGIDQEFSHQGYDMQVEFINAQILPILKKLINNSKTPPVIILEGDHGYYDTDRFANLMAYYGPQSMMEEMYPTISPVNSFRTVFRTVFNAETPNLPDVSYTEDCVDKPCKYLVSVNPNPECK
jgi:hypothetical protein